MFIANTLFLSACLAGVVSSNVIPPRQDADDVPSPTAVALPDETEEAADPVETDCSVWYSVKSGDICENLTVEQHISLDDLFDFNPGLVCSGLHPGDQLCIGIPGREPDPTRPQPILRGTTRECLAYHLLQEDESCYDIMHEYSIPSADLYSWNAALANHCSGLRVGWYICVDVPGFEPDLTTPQPAQPNVRKGCGAYHKVSRGENCWSISVDAGISLADFFEWNPDVDAGCTTLSEDYYVCVSE